MTTTDRTFLNADKIYQELIDAGNDWADKDAAANLLEEGKRTLVSQIASAVQSNSRVEREEEALRSPGYTDYVASMVEARRVANRARVRYQAIQTLAELRRSQESTRRQEMRLA
jgi:hypothetical protein